jgi:pSer/pThr/pTyr-binding forkhead associated (FHA) protein
MWRLIAYDNIGREVVSLEVDGGEVTIGRETDRRVVLPSPAVSRRHACILLEGEQATVIDEGSANGVLIDGVRIDAPTPVPPGARIDIAEFRLQLERLPDEAVAQPGDAGEPGPEPLRLVAEGGPFDGRVFELPAGRVVLGRAADCALVFDDPSLSRKHCALQQTGAAAIELEDLNSSNGTYVNGRRVESGVASVGDVLRFGELKFRLEGEGATGEPFDEPAGAARGRRILYGVAATAAVVLAIGLVVWVVRLRAAGPRGREAIARIAEQAAAHVRTGKERLADGAFDAAAAEFRQALELDPLDAEARHLKSIAEAEPQNDRTAQQLRIKGRLASDRAGLAAALPLLDQIPSESSFREPAAKDLTAKLVSFGEAQCRARRWSDCAWAICKAREVAPPTARPLTATPAAEASLREAEKRLARDRSHTPCKLR